MNNPRFRRFGILMVYITVWFVMAITSADAFLTYRNLNRI